MTIAPPPSDRCVYCYKGWRRIHKDYLYENEAHVQCSDEGLVHLYPSDKPRVTDGASVSATRNGGVLDPRSVPNCSPAHIPVHNRRTS